jgi:hypothetical protein
MCFECDQARLGIARAFGTPSEKHCRSRHQACWRSILASDASELPMIIRLLHQSVFFEWRYTRRSLCIQLQS